MRDAETLAATGADTLGTDVLRLSPCRDLSILSVLPGFISLQHQ